MQRYALGQYGPLPRPIEPWVLDRVMAQPRAAHFSRWVQPQPSLSEVRSRFMADMSDEELLIRLMTSDREIDEMLAAGPLITDGRHRANAIVGNLADLLAESGDASAIQVRTPQLALSVARR